MKIVGIADLKAHLSEHLRNVRKGRTLTVVDRTTPIARIVPYDLDESLTVRRATKKPADLVMPPASAAAAEGLALLLADRSTR